VPRLIIDNDERGLVRIITGSGTYVTQADSTVVSKSIGVLLSRQKDSFNDLIEPAIGRGHGRATLGPQQGGFAARYRRYPVFEGGLSVQDGYHPGGYTGAVGTHA
jgi:hypothetical protein